MKRDDAAADPPQETDVFVDAVVGMSFVVQRLLADAATELDLSVTQLRLLGILRDREPTMQQLARHLRLDKSSVTGLIDRAELRGLVRREKDLRDGRSVCVVITTMGRQLAHRGAAEVRDGLALVTDALSLAQREQLLTAARVIAAAASGLDPAVGREPTAES